MRHPKYAPLPPAGAPDRLASHCAISRATHNAIQMFARCAHTSALLCVLAPVTLRSCLARSHELARASSSISSNCACVLARTADPTRTVFVMCAHLHSTNHFRHTFAKTLISSTCDQSDPQHIHKPSLANTSTKFSNQHDHVRAQRPTLS